MSRRPRSPHPQYRGYVDPRDFEVRLEEKEAKRRDEMRAFNLYLAQLRARPPRPPRTAAQREAEWEAEWEWNRQHPEHRWSELSGEERDKLSAPRIVPVIPSFGSGGKYKPSERWIQHVQVSQHSPPELFAKGTGPQILDWLLRSHGHNPRHAMSALNFYINRAGQNLIPARRRLLEHVKRQLEMRY